MFKKMTAMPSPESPLVIDLDGTLLRTDSLWELVCRALADGHVLSLLWIIFGRASFKRRLAQACSPDLSLLPWNEEVVNLAREARGHGTPVWLATGADEILARKVAAHFGFFSGVLASDGHINLKGAAKAGELVRRFGPRGFAYVGDARCDLAVWRQASIAYVVEDGTALATAAAKVCLAVHSLRRHGGVGGKLLMALRPRHWMKNALLLAAPFLAHDFSLSAFGRCGLGFFIFCLISSAGYLMNDLLDLQADRAHPEKRHRPFAAGDLPLQYGLFLGLTLFAAAFLAALSLGPSFLICVLSYMLLTMAYSFYLKRKALIDIVSLVFLYMLRLVAGTVALSAYLSQWLLCFSFFIFAALCITKRVVELRRLGLNEAIGETRRAYVAGDIPVLSALGGGSVCCATLTLALYVGEVRARELYHSPELLLLFCPPLFLWLARLLLLAERGELLYDPIQFVLRDWPSRLTLVVGFVIYLCATYGWL
jgi:4-hydroxybenzoate polyprenyltransferase/phosphoserine phosphatase